VKSTLVQALVQRLEIESPETLLIIAPKLPRQINALCGNSNCQLKHVEFDSTDSSITELGRFDFAVVFDTLESMSIKSAEQLVSRLRDIHAKLLWIAVDDGIHDRYCSKDAISQGMRMVAPENFCSTEPQWYEFSLKFYKPVPQWLNAEQWANPQRWDKERW